MKPTLSEAMNAVAKHQELRDSATDILSYRTHDFLASWAAWHFACRQLAMANRSGSAGLRGAAMKQVNLAAKRMAARYAALKSTQWAARCFTRVPLVTELAA